MKLKNILTAALLAFVVASLAVALADVTGLRGPGPADTSTARNESTGDRITAYYFHTRSRCTTCKAIEANAHDALAAEAEAGALDWQVIDYEDPSHQHFATRFELLCPSVVLAQYHDGKVTRWKNLERVWDLTDDRPAFLEYVRAELAAFREVQP